LVLSFSLLSRGRRKKREGKEGKKRGGKLPLGKCRNNAK
jgi:hypothetical protein